MLTRHIWQTKIVSISPITFGGGEGTPCSIVSNGADYILKFIINSPGVLWRIYYSFLSSILVLPIHKDLEAYESIQGFGISPWTPRYCRRPNVTVSPM